MDKFHVFLNANGHAVARALANVIRAAWIRWK